MPSERSRLAGVRNPFVGIPTLEVHKSWPCSMAEALREAPRSLFWTRYLTKRPRGSDPGPGEPGCRQNRQAAPAQSARRRSQPDPHSPAQRPRISPNPRPHAGVASSNSAGSPAAAIASEQSRPSSPGPPITAAVGKLGACLPRQARPTGCATIHRNCWAKVVSKSRFRGLGDSRIYGAGRHRYACLTLICSEHPEPAAIIHRAFSALRAFRFEQPRVRSLSCVVPRPPRARRRLPPAPRPLRQAPPSPAQREP
jgi:hypothetical protein